MICWNRSCCYCTIHLNWLGNMNTLSRQTLESPRIYFFYKDCFINPQMIKNVEKIQYVMIILPITAFGLWGWGRYRGWVTYFWWVGTWRSRRHGGHGAVIFYGMYFWAEYGLLEDLTACLLLIWVGDNLVLASRHRRGRRKRLLRLNNDMFFMSICP